MSFAFNIPFKVERGGPSNPYDTDNLVLMWDIGMSENPLVDIISGVTLSGAHTIDADGAVNLYGQSLSGSHADLLGMGAMTVEMYGRITYFGGGYAEGTVCNFGGNRIGFHGSLGKFREAIATTSDGAYGYVIVYGGQSVSTSTNSLLSMSTIPSEVTIMKLPTMLAGGEQIEGQVRTGFYTSDARTSAISIGSSSVRMAVYSVRVYSSERTIEQMLANEAIDISRF